MLVVAQKRYLSQSLPQITEAIKAHAPQYTDEQLADINVVRAELKKFGADVSNAPLKNAGLGALQLLLFCGELLAVNRKSLGQVALGDQ